MSVNSAEHRSCKFYPMHLQMAESLIALMEFSALQDVDVLQVWQMFTSGTLGKLHHPFQGSVVQIVVSYYTAMWPVRMLSVVLLFNKVWM